ncbi:metallophosphoesterase family protein [Rhizobium tumorigenes]|uniref:metallophosphoesterase family protein n=1 Tax=Rhizobium tumorigenes TaxID=2041385 RepID=UPI00241C72DF|nr:DNA repair exonuclease [Rhizobium tumorigenes]WFS01985.1 DNA repair exonuclease [Rhizobium tumorigenes]
MSAFTFIHAADLHLGSPFQGLALKDADIAAVFVDASRKAFSTLVDRAVERRVDFFVIAGDVYDGDWKDNKIGLFFNREMARLERAGIPVYLLKGNHDAESVITRTITLPDNVHQFPTGKPGTFKLEALKVALHGQGFADRSATDNLALGYPAAVPGWFNIGVLHTSLTGREPHANYAPCSLDDLRSRGYDYWALGHVHEYELLAENPAILFPGNLQGRSIRECGPKGALLVSVEDGIVTHTRIIVDEARFGELSVVVDVDDDQQAILRRIQQAVEPLVDDMEERILALRIRLSGESHVRKAIISSRQDFQDEVQAACHRAHADIWLEKLEIRLEDPAGRAVTAGATAGLDLDALIPPATDLPPSVISEAEARLSEIVAKLPGGLGAQEQPLEVDLQSLLAEARDLLVARSGGAV